MQQKDYDKRTALHLASSEGHFECVKYLVENCKVVPTARDRYLNDLFTDLSSIFFVDGDSHR